MQERQAVGEKKTHKTEGVFFLAFLRYCEKEKEKKRDGGKTKRKKAGFSLILKNLHWKVKERKKRIQSRKEEKWGKKKKRRRKREASGRKNKKEQENTNSTSTSQLQRHCFRPSGGTRELFLSLLFHFLENRICRFLP
jgi:hypothetical protein